jgi:hypothetical protein
LGKLNEKREKAKYKKNIDKKSFLIDGRQKSFDNDLKYQ